MLREPGLLPGQRKDTIQRITDRIGDPLSHVFDRIRCPEFGGQRRHPGIADAARHDRGEGAEVTVAVQGEAVQRRVLARGYRSRRSCVRSAGVGRHPHPGAALYPSRLKAKLGARGHSDSSRRRT